MIIAVNTRQLQADDAKGRAGLISNCFSALAKKHPGHRFIFIFDQAFDQRFITSDNIIPVVAGPEAKTPLRLRYWFNYKIPSVLKKYKADVFVSMEGICSLRTKVPQCLLLHDLSFLHYPQFYPKSRLRFYKKFTPKFLAKARVVAVMSAPVKEDIAERFSIDKEKIHLVYRSADAIFQPIDEKEKERIKEKYTEGKEYFLYAGSIGPGKNLINLLKAFSFFKKRQKSSMQLVIAGKSVNGHTQFTTELGTFKFRNEVKWLEDLPPEEHAKLVAGAYAMAYPVFIEDQNAVVMESMQCNVPVILSASIKLPEYVANAILYANPTDFMDIADKMMLIFKDEEKRNQLVKAGQAAARAVNPAKTADMLWDCIVASIK